MKKDARFWFRAILLAGVLLRIFQWVYNRSLWVDEAMLALNIRELDFAGLMQPLKYEQVAPILFLWIERAMVSLLGDNELVLRIFPLLCGIAVLWLVYLVAEKSTGDRKAALLTLFLFAFSRCFVYFSTETKQYSSDLLVTLFFYSVLLSDNKHRNMWLLLIGLIAVWLSNIGVVLIAVAGCSFGLEQWRKRRPDFRQWSMFLICVGGFILYFFRFIHGHPSGETMDDYWDQHFMPTDPTNVKFWVWLVQHIVGNYSTFLGVNIHLNDVYRAAVGTFTAGLALAGFVRWYNSKDRPDWLLLLAAPVVIHLALAALRLYPFNGRLILYLSPSFLILSAYGAIGIYNRARDFLLVRWAIAGMVLAFLGFISIWLPIRLEEMKDCIHYVNRNRCQPVYAYAAAIPAARYYSQSAYSLEENRLSGDLSLFYSKDTSELKAQLLKRDSVWVIASHKDAQVAEVMSMGANARKALVTSGAAVILLTR